MIDKEQMKWILSYSMVTGPAFLIGAVGVEFLGSHKLGVILAVSHYASAIVNCVFYGLGTASKNRCGATTWREMKATTTS